MGFAVVMVQIMFFSAIIIGLSVVVVENYQNNIMTAESKSIQSTVKQAQNQAELVLINGSYDSLAIRTIIFVQNKGATPFFVDALDIYLDNVQINRNDSTVDKDIVIDAGNPRMVDTGERLRITHDIFLNDGTHEYTIADPFGATIRVPIVAVNLEQQSASAPTNDSN